MNFERVQKGGKRDEPNGDHVATTHQIVDDELRGSNTRFIWITFLMLVYFLELGVQVCRVKKTIAMLLANCNVSCFLLWSLLLRVKTHTHSLFMISLEKVYVTTYFYFSL